MDKKHHQTALLMHRPRKRKNLLDFKQEQKSQNLKSLHRTLLCEENQRLIKVQKEVPVEINNQKNISKRLRSQHSGQRAVNFYINIQKLKHLKIGGKQRNTRSGDHTKSLINPYLRKQQVIFDRKSQLLKSYAHKRHQSSQSQISNASNQSYSRPQIVLKNYKNQRKIRYKTQNDEQVRASSYMKQSNNYLQVSLQKKQKQQQSRKILLQNKQKGSKGTSKAAHKDRTFIEGFLRGKQLGRGGFSKVWQGFDLKSKQFYAIKQIDTTNKYQTHLTQIWFGQLFFDKGTPRPIYQSHPGINSLLKMYKYQISQPRAFIVFQNCNGSLGNLLYDIYEQDRADDIDEQDKLYMIKYKPLYGQLRRDTKFVKKMLYQIAQALDLLQKQKIVHSDIKTQNILMNIPQKRQNINNVQYEFKLIDYGSSFIFQNLKQYKLATPQYMCPQLLNYILFQNKKQHKEQMLEYVKKYQNTSAIDVWGLGCIILQLIHGIPLWLTNRTKIFCNGRYQTKRGLFAINDRSFAKILQKQLNLINNLDSFLRKQNNSGMAIDDTLRNLIQGMLQPNPAKRIRPFQILAVLSK